MTRCVTAALAALLLAALVLSGCSRELGPDPARGAAAPASPDTARAKLRLQIQDPCYGGDARTAWPRCGRWIEEIAGTARTAAAAVPNDPVITEASGTVAAGREAFLGPGCATGASADAGACVAALDRTRGGVRALVGALGVPGS